jgi:hypothetical protein
VKFFDSFVNIVSLAQPELAVLSVPDYRSAQKMMYDRGPISRVRTGEVLDHLANAPCERGNYINVLGASAEPRPLLSTS